MRIEEIHVGEFGIIDGLELAGLTEGLTVFCGDNESGKTTLMNFIRQVLFGFPRKGSGILYPPEKGRGGRLVVVDDEGERYVIERVHRGRVAGDVTVTLPDGSSGGEEVLSRLFPGTDQKLFENVFAFTIDELHSFDSLEGVKSALFSASMGLAPSVSLGEVLGSLDERQKRIFNPHRKGAQLDKHLKKAREIQKEIDDLAVETDRYDELVDRLEKRRGELDGLKESLRENADATDRNNTLLGAWGDYQLIKEWEEELESIPAVEAFPEDGGSLLREKKQSLREKQESLKQLKGDIELNEKKRDELAVNEAAMENSGLVKGLVERNKHYLEAEKDLSAVRNELEAQRANLSDLKSGLGPDWDDDRLMSFDISTDMKNRVKGFKEELASAERARRLESESLKRAEERQEEAGRKKDKLEAAFSAMVKPVPFEGEARKEVRAFKSRVKGAEDQAIARSADLENAKKTLRQVELKREKARAALESLEKPAVADEEKLSNGRRAVRTVRDYVASLAKDRSSLGHEQRFLEEKERELGRARVEVDTATRWWGFAAAALGLVVGVVLVVTGQVAIGAVAGVAILAMGLAFFIQQSRKLGRRREESEKGDLRLAEQVENARAAVNRLSESIRQKSEKLSEYARQLDLGEEVTPEGIQRYEDFLETQERLLVSWKQAKERLAELEDELKEAGEALEAARREKEKADEQMSLIKKEWPDFLVGAGFPETLDPDEALGEIEERERSLIKWKDAESRLEESKKECESARGEVESEKGELEKAEKDEAAAEDSWKAWLKDNGLSETFDPDEALMSIEYIKTGRSTLREVEKLESRIEEMNGTVSGYRSDAERLFEACGLEVTDTDAYLETVNQLNGELDLSKTNLAKRESYEKQIEEANERGRALEERIGTVQREIDELLSQGGAKDEEEFLAREKAFERRRQLLEDIEESRNKIIRMVGSGERYEGFVKELEKTSREELDREKNRLKQVAEELGFKNDELVREITSLGEEIKRITSREDIEKKRMEMEGELARARDLAREWDGLTTTSFFIRKAKRKYEEEKQPQVIKEAENFFSLVTEGAYKGIYAPIGEEEIVVVRPDEERLDQDMLSRGTVEQLYLSLRYGYIRTGKRQYPVIADEVLVNFDPDRCLAALKGLMELSRTHQVFYFTCHPETLDIARELEGDLRAFEMAEGEARALV